MALVPVAEVAAQRTAVLRVVVAAHQLGKQLGQVAFVGPRLPAGDGLVALQLLEAAQQVSKGGGVVAQVGVVAQQEVQAGFGAGVDFHQVGAGAQVGHHVQRQADAADAGAFAFGVDGAGGIQALQRGVELGLELFLGRLGLAGPGAQHGALVAGHAFEVQHLGALGSHGLQDAGLGGAGLAAQHHQAQAVDERRQAFDDVAAEGLVAALELLGVPAGHAHPGDHGAAAQATAPAVHQGAPAFGFVGKGFCPVAAQVGGHQTTADAACLEGALLLVDGADQGAFLVIQDGMVDSAGQVVEGIFGGGTGVDEGIEITDGLDAHRTAMVCHVLARWRREMGVEPTRRRMAPPTGFEARPTHRDRVPSGGAKTVIVARNCWGASEQVPAAVVSP